MGRSTNAGTLVLLLALGIVCTFRRIIHELPTLGNLLSPIIVATNETNNTTITTSSEHNDNPLPSNNKTSALFHLFQEYASWHATQLEEIRNDPDSWTNKTYLVMECRTKLDPTTNQTQLKWGPCGGLADRLKPFPLVLWVAAKSRRIFFISWNRPFGLEAFLEPVAPSATASNSLMGTMIDWRVPEELSKRGFHDETHTQGMIIDHEKLVYPRAMKKDIQILRTKIQSPGEQTFTKKTGGVVYTDIYSQLWHSLFRPVPRLQQKMDAQLTKNQLVSDQYVATHLRLQYMYGPNDKKKTKAQITVATTHALQCASVMYPGVPIFVATDSPKTVRPVVQDLVQKYENDPEMMIRIVMLPYSSNTTTATDKVLHLDHDPEWQSRTPDEYDSVFLDLYLLGQARCVIYGRGGYGKFGSLLSSGAATCGFDVSAIQIPCPWTLGNGTTLLHNKI
jgi:hypothetical protein